MSLNPRTPARSLAGFTLIELMVTIAIAAILASIAIPSFRDTIFRNRITTTAASIQSDIAYARAESIRRGIVITLCPANPTAMTCAISSNWSSGWLVFADTNGDGKLDSTETTLRERKIENNLSVSGVSGTLSTESTLRARPNGELLQNGVIRVCAAGYLGQDITIQRSGNIRSSATVSKCPA